MKRRFLLLSALMCSAVYADETDWLNFATGRDGTAVVSVLFQNRGRLTFGQAAMVYEDDGDSREIDYEAGAYIYFSSEPANGIESLAGEAPLALVYSPATQLVTLSGAEAAEQLRLVSMQGATLRVESNSPSVSTAGLPQGIVIATAVCRGKTISRKFIIK